MNTNVSIYKEPVVLDKGETKEACDCGGSLVRRYTSDHNGHRATQHHCTSCTQDYYELRGKITTKKQTMDYKQLDEVAAKLERKYIPESAKGNQEAKEILAFTQFYRITKAKILKTTADID